MKIFNFLKNPWIALITFLIAIAGPLMTVYYEKYPEITYEVIMDSSVFDIHTPMADLDIRYKEKSLKKGNLSLRMVVLKMKNSGSVNIKKDDFDTVELLGLKINNGQILDKPTFTTSDKYLTRTIVLTTTTEREVVVAPFLFDRNEWIQISVLAAIENGANSEIQAIGKVSGVKNITMLAIGETTKTKSLWNRITAADALWIQVLRGILYSLGFFGYVGLILMIISVVMFFMTSFSQKKEKQDKEKLIEEYSLQRNLTVADQVLVKTFRNLGAFIINDCEDFIAKAGYLTRTNRKIKDAVDEKTRKDIISRYYLWTPIALFKVNDQEWVTREDSNIYVSEDMKRAISDFRKFLEEKGKLKKKDNTPKTLEELWPSRKDVDNWWTKSRP